MPSFTISFLKPFSLSKNKQAILEAIQRQQGISESGGGKQGLPSGWPHVVCSQTPPGRHQEVGLREKGLKRLTQTVGVSFPLGQTL